MEAVFILESPGGDLEDVAYVCGWGCRWSFIQQLEPGTPFDFGRVFSPEVDYDCYCPTCGVLLIAGLETEPCDNCPPTVRGRICKPPTNEFCDECGRLTWQAE